MKLYWPCAVCLTAEGNEEPVSTYDAALSLAEARQQIERWKDWYHYNIIRCWVDEYEKSVKLRTIHIHPVIGTIINIEMHKKEESPCLTPNNP